MDKIPIEILQRHILVTGLKSNAECVITKLEKQSLRRSESFRAVLKEMIEGCWPKQTAYCDDNWYRCDVPVDKCYFAHTDFRHRWVPKDLRFVDFLKDSHRLEIELGSFPCSWEIRAPWESSPMLPPVVEQRDADDWTMRVATEEELQRNIGRERYYILDGQMRLIRHWYHQKLAVSAYIYRGQREV